MKQGAEWLFHYVLQGVGRTSTIERSGRAAQHDSQCGKLRRCHPINRIEREVIMKNPLDSLWGTVISGLILTLILYLIVKSMIGG